MDVPTAQVLLEARIVEISTNDRERFGVRFSPDGTRAFSDDDDFDDSLIASGSAMYRNVFVGSELTNALRTGIFESTMDLDVLVQFLKKFAGTQVRSEPRINIADNELGQVFVGQRIPFIEDS